MPMDIFISYVNSDVEFVKQLQIYLEKEGFSIGVDPDAAREQNDLEHRHQVGQLIQASKLFLLVQSPAALTSAKVKDEIRRADGKDGIRLVWQPTAVLVKLPEPLYKFTVVDFGGEASAAQFAALIKKIRIFLPAPSPSSAMPQRRLNKSVASALDPIAIGGLVVSTVVSTFELDPQDETYVKQELRWLFKAIDHFFKIMAHEVGASQSIPEPIPPEAEREPYADNSFPRLERFKAIPKGLVNETPESYRSYLMNEWGNTLSGNLRDINIHLKNLRISLNEEARLGAAALLDLKLQNDIKQLRMVIIEITQEAADTIYQIYGIKINSPHLLLEFLKTY